MDGAAKGCNLDQLIEIFSVLIFKKENIMLKMQELLFTSAKVVVVSIMCGKGVKRE